MYFYNYPYDLSRLTVLYYMRKGGYVMTSNSEDASNTRNSAIFVGVIFIGALLLVAFYFVILPVLVGRLSGFNRVGQDDRFFFDLSSGATTSSELTVANPAYEDMRGYLTVDPSGEYDEQFTALVITIDEPADTSAVEVYRTPAGPIDLGEFTSREEVIVHATLKDFSGSGGESSTVMIPVLVEFS